MGGRFQLTKTLLRVIPCNRQPLMTSLAVQSQFILAYGTVALLSGVVDRSADARSRAISSSPLVVPDSRPPSLKKRSSCERHGGMLDILDMTFDLVLVLDLVLGLLGTSF
ncbi:hypothetical protein MAPG_02907 [Magnaporthiopsis poae ATCC 64411]|uniref:Uncharacterized protein n=1 Tax=Magnaporthiopsis poae (strain ATCC 64411 / 73-15) TaxID=644358 RepID=A0A0C4DSM5_MAGP6|nr:hypothetical protein MAPG_02907 [Magnaporthiopsis poae ATCC 64411]